MNAAPLAHDDAAGRPAPGEKLAQMANQIADFFAPYPEEQAVAAIADHINQFWTRRMRSDLRAAFAADPAPLSPLVRQALARLGLSASG